MNQIFLKFLFLLTVLLPFSVIASADESTSTDASSDAKKTDAEWKMGLFGRSTDDSLSSSKTVGLNGMIKVDHQFSDSLSAEIRGGVLLETGSSSALFTDEFRPDSYLYLEEASFKWHILDPLYVKVGAINQDGLESPLLVSDENTFPALEEVLEKQFGAFTAQLEAQQAIPTSQRLTSKSDGKENTPSLLTETASIKYTQKDDFSVKLRATHYQFSNLTHGIAQDSRFYGNTIIGVATGSTFYYQYQGIETGADIKVDLAKNWDLDLQSSYVHNSEVPQDLSNGQYYAAEVKYKNSNFSLAPKYEFYTNEGDSVPGFYSSREFGHNNREGNGIAIKTELYKTGLNFELSWIQSHLIQDSTFQRNKFQFIQLNMEIPYAHF